ncbi:SpoIIIAH-like family protein [Alicyclobacillus pomorum]|uniref:SpoIIIAH-like family protein n=1 Tax=Alicyclobacillus pomorum TaxID=204470 RepID=UPI0004274199|nr:SpoIIIAH-like family protein [Alicyclobacillus pomorum]
MVKRQTVWLSTMMVLSLMLIGYYTMNNESSTTGSAGGTSDTSPTSVTTTTTPDTSGDGSTKSTSSQTKTPATTSSAQNNSGSPTNSTDWYVSTQTQLEQQITQKMDNYEKIITNDNATPDQISQAQQQLNRLTSLEGGIENAHDAIVGKGYKDCVIMPNSDYTQFTVYVKTDKLSADQAVQLMQLVSQQLNVSAVNIKVGAKA